MINHRGLIFINSKSNGGYVLPGQILKFLFLLSNDRAYLIIFALFLYYFFMVTAGWNTKGKVIVKRVHITQNRSYEQALRLAKQVRKELASDYGKQFINKKPR
jgi:hypothetical protein